MTDKEIIQALRCCADGECKDCAMHEDKQRCQENLLDKAADFIERLTAENVVLPDGEASAIESLLKEIEWKDKVIALAQREQAKAEAESDALRHGWVFVDDKLPAPGTRVIATDGVFVGEAYRTSADTWRRYDGIAMRDCIGSVVTHWMPLPETPEEGEKV